MTKSSRPFSPAEIALAKQMFARAQAAGTLKPPRAIAALALSNGYRRTVSASTVTYRDYLRDARRELSGRN